MEPVYCYCCQHARKDHPWQPASIWECAASPQSHAVYPGGERYEFCTHINGRNDCPKFARKLSLWQRLVQILS